MARQRGTFVGRRSALGVLAQDRQAGLTVIRGSEGIGKSALAQEFRRELRERGAVVLEIGCGGELPDWDQFGVTLLLAALREQFELLQADTRLPEAIDRVSRLCSPETYRSPWLRFCLLNALSTLFGRVSVTGRIAVLVEDAHRLGDPVLAIAVMRRAGHLVVATCALDSASGQDKLCAVADQVVDLGPLTEDETAVLLQRTLHAEPDPMLEGVLRRALGPLWGNPAAVLGAISRLRAEERLVVVHGAMCLRAPLSPVALPDRHHLVRALARFGEAGRDLVLLAAEPAGFAVDQLPVLAAATGRPVPEYGGTTDELVTLGILDCDASARLRCRVPAVAAALRTDATAEHLALLHADMAVRLRERLGDEGSAVLVEHVVAARTALPPDPDLARRLAAAPPVAGGRTEHLRAMWWHAAERAAPRAELIQHLVRTTEYDRLGRFVAEAARAGTDAAGRVQLTRAAVLASVHTGEPVDESVVAGEEASRAVLALLERWNAGVPLNLDALHACFPEDWLAPAVTRTPQPAGGARMRAACAVRDLVPLLSAVLGPDYGTPTRGPLAAHHRARKAFAAGDWTTALSAARELVLRGDADRTADEHVRVLAAEISGWRGEDDRAEAWLLNSPGVTSLPLWRGWAEAGLRAHTDVAGAFEIGWQAYHRHGRTGDVPGKGEMLARLVSLALRGDEPHRVRDVAALARRWREESGSASAEETHVLVSGLAEGDDVRIGQAVQTLRVRGEQYKIALLGQPDAVEVAHRIGAPRLLAHARALVADAPVPASASADADLSETHLAILDHIRAGRTNRQIAQALRMSEKTVEKNLTRLFAKAGCRTRYGLAVSALGQAEPVGV
ncbi:LuxR family transcriptional regulator [Lentzea sp. NBRC 102530]|uniref:helix-turn-helix transcriptional regulator n=1 Tax=Lentzea sp. NBRC 102530 TaxID=3032201 RepID=UPI0024A3182A|nr:LuxR family transcriptional regulator [Lentzea sp. NBRC 102530]GLY46833.1 hypothetical protein Lesp01_04890 [Lentzea sp. NBRC 102530]